MSQGRNKSQSSQRQRHRSSRQPPDTIVPIDAPWIYETIRPSNYDLLPKSIYQKLKSLQQLKAHDLVRVPFTEGPDQQQQLASMRLAASHQEQIVRTLCPGKKKEQNVVEHHPEEAQQNQPEVFFGLNDLNINAFRQQNKNNDFQSLMEPHQENQNKALYTDADQFFLLP